MTRSRRQIVISREHALEGAYLAAVNARRLLAFSGAGVKAGGCGPAIALCVLASEEGAKALALLFEAVSPQPTGISVADMLTRHRSKHDLSQIASLMVHLIGLMRRIRDEVQSEVDGGVIPVKQAGSRWVAQIVQELKRMTDHPSDEETRFITWYRSANRLKNDGLYVDWKDGCWHDPNVATRVELDEYRGYVEWWLDLVDEILTIPKDQWEAAIKELERLKMTTP